MTIQATDCAGPDGEVDPHVTLAVARYPHTEDLRSRKLPLEGYELIFADVEPIHRAFAPMVRELRYDVAELALVTLLQAVEAGVPIVPLPVVVHGNFHHRSLWTLGSSRVRHPDDLRGRRVGIRAYSQTTGLWVRGVLADSYGVAAEDVTWATTEGPHVAAATDPENVIRTTTPLVDALRAGELDAVVMGRRSIDHVPELVPLITDWQSQEHSFYDEHGWVPINHLVAVRRDVLQQQPDVVRAVYEQLASGIRTTKTARDAGPVSGRAVQAGIGKSLLAPLDAAIRQAREQRLISIDIHAADLFSEVQEFLGES